jgi:hypothetical protein
MPPLPVKKKKKVERKDVLGNIDDLSDDDDEDQNDNNKNEDRPDLVRIIFFDGRYTMFSNLFSFSF